MRGKPNRERLMAVLADSLINTKGVCEKAGVPLNRVADSLRGKQKLKDADVEKLWKALDFVNG